MTTRSATLILLVLLSGTAYAQPAPRRALAGQAPANISRPGNAATNDLPEPEVTITIEDEYRLIRSNGLPAHSTGAFPNAGNPNAIRAQHQEYRVPLTPAQADTPLSARPEFGIAVNGVIFDAGTAEFWSANGRLFGGGSAWNYEALGGGVPLGIDHNHAHVQPTGKYHYHGVPTGLLEQLGGDEGVKQMLLIGWAADGYPIYGPYAYNDPNDPESGIRQMQPSYALKEGKRPDSPEGPGGEYDGTFTADWVYQNGLGDLDECNGRTGITPEFPEGTYYYVVTETFPAVPRLWHGQPDASWRQRGGPNEGFEDGPRGRPGARPGPRPDGERRPPERRPRRDRPQPPPRT